MWRKVLIQVLLRVLGAGSVRLRHRWAAELRRKGLLAVLVVCSLPLLCGCADEFKLWYVKTHDVISGYEENTKEVPSNDLVSYDVVAVNDMLGREPRLSHIRVTGGMRPEIMVQSYGSSGLCFRTSTFGSLRNDLSRNYETLILTRFRDGEQKVFGTSWPAADSRAFRDDTHSFDDVERFMVVLNRGRVNGKTGKVMGKAELVEYSEVIVL